MFASVLQILGLIGLGVVAALTLGVVPGVVGGVAFACVYVGLALEKRAD